MIPDENLIRLVVVAAVASVTIGSSHGVSGSCVNAPNGIAIGPVPHQDVLAEVDRVEPGVLGQPRRLREQGDVPARKLMRSAEQRQRHHRGIVA